MLNPQIKNLASACTMARSKASQGLALVLFVFVWLGMFQTHGAELKFDENNTLELPAVGTTGLRVLSPTILELTLINRKDPAPATVPMWNFVSEAQALTLPAVSEFSVTVNGAAATVTQVGFKRRPLSAPLSEYDLRLQDCLYLKLAQPVADNASVQVKNPSAKLWPGTTTFTASTAPLRFNPAIHVNQIGYMPAYVKKAMIGHYLGSMGELPIPAANGFKLVDAASGAVVFTGALTVRKDAGFTYSPLPYQQVYQADFTAFQTPGAYKLQVPGMGVSLPFLINDGITANYARTFALGMYHQRCGTALEFPHTRHEHGICHENPAAIPTMDSSYAKVQEFLATVTSDWNQEPRHTAPRLSNVAASRYPILTTTPANAVKGHHDAGDYSKYTINSASLVHHLVFAADSFPGAGALDNLGLPESGDGKSDLLQEAKWEADFLANLQDTDGGFFFLVYPKDRRYENDVLPDDGDPQVVWPKNTAATAAAVGALAEAGSSPLMKQQFPADSAIYLQKAQLGWSFLTNAIARYGKDGSYQQITHYGKTFIHDDELAWAASAMYAATGQAAYHQKLKEWFPDPNAVSTRRWNWWRLYEGYGCAVRTYAFAVSSGRLTAGHMDSAYLTKCTNEIKAAADDHVRFSNMSAYGTSFPDNNKSQLNAGWYFSSERAFDITVAYQLTNRADYLEAIIANFNYETGVNPVNMTFITGIGQRRQRDVVHQHAQNDHAVLPPSGLPQGNVVDGLGYLYHYGSELGRLSYPSDLGDNPYPYYDRWTDSYHTKNEFVVVDLARSLASLSFWMAQGPKKTQSWKAAAGTITGLPAQGAVGDPITVGLTAPGIDFTGATVTWEVLYKEPALGTTYTFSPSYPGETWIEAEALLPDGRRVFALSSFVATTGGIPPNSYQSAPVTVSSETQYLFHLDSSSVNSAARGGSLSLGGNARFDTNNLGWLAVRSGAALRFADLGDKATLSIPTSALVESATKAIRLEGMIYINQLKAYGRAPAKLLSLYESYDARLELTEDTYAGLFAEGGRSFSVSGSSLGNVLTLKNWHHFALEISRTGYTLSINGHIVAVLGSTEFNQWGKVSTALLELGNFDGWIDEIVVRKVTNNSGAPWVGVTSSGDTFTAPASISLSANVLSSLIISKVEFFANGGKIGEDTTAPYSISWNNVVAGSYSVTARATDSLGTAGTSAPRTITVQAPPRVETPVITPAGGNYGDSVQVVIITATPGATIRYTLDGSAVLTTSAIYTGPLTLTRTTTVQAKAYKAGMDNSLTASATFTVNEDVVNSAVFLAQDTATQGNWRGAYGEEGYHVFGTAASFPSGVEMTSSGATEYMWTDNTTEQRALVHPEANGRLVVTRYSANSMNYNVKLNDGLFHKVSFYFLDWDNGGRTQVIEVLDAASGGVLDSRTVTAFQNGKYLSWKVRGNVTFRIRRQTGNNALLMGIFLDAVPVQAPATLTPLGPVSNGFKLRLSGQAGATYKIEGSSNNRSWSEVGTVTLTNSTIDYVDGAATTATMKFYRATTL